MNSKTIWTIGHSTHTIEEFVELLQSQNIECVADVRSLPGSRKFPQFNKENLEESLPKNKIEYTHIKKLGGLRKVNPESKHTVWRNPSFRAYADYMDTPDFEEGLNELTNLAQKHRVAYMCSEVLWWRCHRSMISDVLKTMGWNVIHILSTQKTEKHRYTAPAQIVNGKLTYPPANPET